MHKQRFDKQILIHGFILNLQLNVGTAESTHMKTVYMRGSYIHAKIKFYA